MQSFVLGNGKSRLAVDANLLRKHGRTYSCNRAYQDFESDVLISVDKPMAEEIQQSGYSKTHTHYTRVKNIIEGSGALPIPRNEGWSSGPVATVMASLEGADKIFLLGMDLVSSDKRFNNIYADTLHYKKSTDTETFGGNWEDQIKECIKEFSSIIYYHVIPEGGYSPNKWKTCPNLAVITIEELYGMINT